jgi:hypothetical protein
MMTNATRRNLLGAVSALLVAVSAPAFAQAARQDQAVSLFKIVTVKDEVVIGLSAGELASLGGSDAGAVAKAPAPRAR